MDDAAVEQELAEADSGRRTRLGEPRTLALRHRAQTAAVEDFDAILSLEADQAPAPEVREHPADGFLGEPKIIGDVDAAHRQVESPLGNAARAFGPLQEREEEARQTLGGSLAAKQDHLSLRLRQLVRGQPIKLPLYLGILSDEAIKGIA